MSTMLLTYHPGRLFAEATDRIRNQQPKANRLIIAFPRNMNTTACLRYCRQGGLRPRQLVSIDARPGEGQVHTFTAEIGK